MHLSNLLPPVILASKSPRRQEILSQMGIKFSVVAKDVDESFPALINSVDVPAYIAAKKMLAFNDESKHALVITADTIVLVDNNVLGKPADEKEAERMLRLLSGRAHKVITGISLKYNEMERSVSEETTVHFDPINEGAINY